MSLIEERKILMNRFIREEVELYNVAKEIGLAIASRYDEKYLRHQKSGEYFYIPSDEKNHLIEEIARSISDEMLLEIFTRLKPRDWSGVRFRGKFYIYEEDKGLTLGDATKEIRKDVFEALNLLGERGYAFLMSIIELHEEGKWKGDFYGATYSDVLAKIRKICGKLILPAPRDFPILTSYRIYFKSGSRKYPGHSIPEEIIPALKEALLEWRKHVSGKTE
jgi:hypothetical protein